MANRDAPSGLSPVGHLLGLNWSERAQMYYVPSNNTDVIAMGDPVVLSGEADANGVPAVALATAGSNPCLGAVISGAGASIYGGPLGGAPAETPIVIPATKTRAYYILVSDDPFIIFAGQEDSDGGNIAAASIGLNVNLIAGVNNGFLSGWEIDSSSVGSGSTLMCKLLRARQIQGNTLGSANCVFEVLINNHPFKAGVAGI